MRSDFNANLDTLSNKIDGISSSINELKMENELLREENIKMKEKLDRLYSKVDNLEGHSHRNSLTLSQTTNFRLFQIERGCRRQFQI